MKTKDVFREFMILEYYPGQKPKGIKDTFLKMYTINRISREGWNIISFYNGTTIYIPWTWIDIFKSLNIWGGYKVLSSESVDKIDITILNFLKLVGAQETEKSGIFLEVLSDICKTGTTIFREWIKKEFKMIINPLEFTSLDKYKLI